MESETPRIDNIILKNKVGELTFQDFKTYYKPTVIRRVWF